ncbi:hypothetical protein L1987_49232 [Smallanthus sonchifolius]|uniref:Uncharacterized protein n=1 Tax=Smallanthus sonchifolius TaxID=185202 RepID=A0ACB9FVS6_9ASTR|nr:hypothetical protein L1987_49232 [Smallanthus sonchifolius]
MIESQKATCLDASLSYNGKGKGKSYDSEVFHGFHLVKGKFGHDMEDYHVAEYITIQGHVLGLFAIFDGHLGDPVGSKSEANGIAKAEEEMVMTVSCAKVRFAIRDDRFAGYGHVEFATLDAAQEIQGLTAFVKGFGYDENFDNVRSALEGLFGQCVEISRMSIPKDYDSGGLKWKVLFYVTRIHVLVRNHCTFVLLERFAVRQSEFCGLAGECSHSGVWRRVLRR